MANHKSAIKRHKQSLKRRDRNRSARAAVRTSIKTVKIVAAKGDEKMTTESLRIAQRTLAKAASKGLVHKKNAARRISRLAKAIKK